MTEQLKRSVVDLGYGACRCRGPGFLLLFGVRQFAAVILESHMGMDNGGHQAARLPAYRNAPEIASRISKKRPLS